MDEATAEQLSRYLDGDLDVAATGRLEARLAAEPDLAVELAALRRLQLQVRSVADRMVPPAELDAPLRLPDRLAPRAPRGVSPAVRWLGLAAGVALAVTVAVEVVRRPPAPAAPAGGPAPHAAPAAAPSKAAGTAQAPAPATAPPRSDDEVAGTDAAPPAEPARPAPAAARRRPQPPEQKELSIAAEQQSGAATGRTEAATGKPLADAAGAVEDRAAPPSPNESVAGVAAAPTGGRAKAVASDQAAGELVLGAPAGAGNLRLELAGADGVVLDALALPAASADIGSRFVVTVAAGVIVTIEPDAAGSAALAHLIGQRLTGLPDGRYVGVVVGDASVP